MDSHFQARSQDFSWGRRGSAFLKNRDQIINFGMIGHASVVDTRLLRGVLGRAYALPEKL